MHYTLSTIGIGKISHFFLTFFTRNFSLFFTQTIVDFVFFLIYYTYILFVILYIGIYLCNPPKERKCYVRKQIIQIIINGGSRDMNFIYYKKQFLYREY